MSGNQENNEGGHDCSAEQGTIDGTGMTVAESNLKVVLSSGTHVQKDRAQRRKEKEERNKAEAEERTKDVDKGPE